MMCSIQNDRRRDIIDGNNYVEWLVRRGDLVYTVPVKVLMVAVYIFSVFSALQAMFRVIIMTITGVATYFIFLNLNAEFEYLFAEDGFSADRILGRAKRKKIFDCEKDSIQIVASVGSFVPKNHEKQGMRVKDFSSDGKEAKVYTLIYQKGPNHFKVPIEPNERMIGAMRRTFPRKLVM